MKTPIHKTCPSWGVTQCNLSLYPIKPPSPTTTERWEGVTCKKCLANRTWRDNRMEKRWVIIGKPGLYIGQWLTRKDAIEEHCKDLGVTWKRCYRKGDRVIKATITWRC